MHATLRTGATLESHRPNATRQSVMLLWTVQESTSVIRQGKSNIKKTKGERIANVFAI